MSPSEYSEEISYYVTSDIDSADFNNDGLMDIVLQADGGSTKWTRLPENEGFPYIFINRQNQEFLPISYNSSNIAGLYGLDAIVPGDFNGDGLIDIIGIFSRDNITEIRAFYKEK